MPASQIIFMESVLFSMAVFIAIVTGLARFIGCRVSQIATSLFIVCFASLPFLFWCRTAVYHGVPAHGDTSLGWPFIYAHAQSDAGISWENPLAFFLNLALGISTGIALLLCIRENRSRNYSGPQ